MENECEALPGVAYPGVRDNRSTINTKTGYDDDDDAKLQSVLTNLCICLLQVWLEKLGKGPGIFSVCKVVTTSTDRGHKYTL